MATNLEMLNEISEENIIGGVSALKAFLELLKRKPNIGREGIIKSLENCIEAQKKLIMIKRLI